MPPIRDISELLWDKGSAGAASVFFSGSGFAPPKRDVEGAADGQGNDDFVSVEAGATVIIGAAVEVEAAAGEGNRECDAAGAGGLGKKLGTLDVGPGPLFDS